MAKMRWFRTSCLAAITSMLSLALAAQTGDTAAIQQKLNSQFKLTTITADRSDIVTAGDIVAIHKPGLMMYAVASPMPPSNSYKNGKIGQGWGGFGKDLAIGMAAPGGATAASYPHRPFVPEEKCWVTGIQVQKDGVLFQLYSDPYDNIRYYANLKIPFPDKKTVPPVDIAVQTVAEVLTVVPPQDQGGQGSQPAPVPAPAVAEPQVEQEIPPFGTYFLKETGARLHLAQNGSFVLLAAGGRMSPGLFTINGDALALTYSATGSTSLFKIQGDRLVADTGLAWVRQGSAPVTEPPPAPAPASYGDIAPPPPPPPPAPTISIGQTKDQVTAAFGDPVRKAIIGTKEIYFYKDMKVTFTSGKVSDVE
ncbi:MAG: hypothetical protein ABSE99_14185 [Terracidiphilus sp.]